MTKKKAKKTLARKIAGRTYHVDVPVHVDADGEEIIKAQDLTRADLSIAAVIAGEGPVLGETFSWMRRALGLQARQLAELLDVRPESVSRWERGERPMDRAAWLLLAGVVLDRGPAGRAARMDGKDCRDDAAAAAGGRVGACRSRTSRRQRPRLFGQACTQLSRRSAATRPNSRWLFVTRIARRATA